MADESNKHAWAAGFMDGEGTFTLGRHKKARNAAFRAPAISAVQVCIDPLIVLQDLYGGAISIARITSTGKTAHQWRCRRAGVIFAIESMLPFLIVKKNEARVVLEYALLPSRRGTGYSEQDEQERMNIIERFDQARAA